VTASATALICNAWGLVVPDSACLGACSGVLACASSVPFGASKSAQTNTPLQAGVALGRREVLKRFRSPTCRITPNGVRPVADLAKRSAYEATGLTPLGGYKSNVQNCKQRKNA
jgi:hypothetical protein